MSKNRNSKSKAEAITEWTDDLFATPEVNGPPPQEAQGSGG